MQALFFWRDWSRTDRTIWFVFGTVFILSLGYLWFSWARGYNNVIDWNRIQEQKVIDTIIHSFRVGAFGMNVPAESYAIFEYLQGGNLYHNTLASYIFLVVLMGSAMLLLAVISAFERFWYFAATGLFIVFVVSLRLDVLAIFGLVNFTMPIGVMVLFVSLSYYFKSYRPHSTIALRLICFSAAAMLIGAIIYFFAESPLPFLHLAVASYIPALVLTLLFRFDGGARNHGIVCLHYQPRRIEKSSAFFNHLPDLSRERDHHMPSRNRLPRLGFRLHQYLSAAHHFNDSRIVGIQAQGKSV
jgi:hypothetical protein